VSQQGIQGKTARERNGTFQEWIGELWNLSADTVRRMFEDEPGVLDFEKPVRRRAAFGKFPQT
jgi:hypothetical protein